MATRTDSEHRIREELDWLGCRPAGSFRIERAQHENQFIAAATAGRLRPIVTSWHLIYAEPDGGRQIVCAAFGYEEIAVEILDILSGRLTGPNLGGYSATSRVPLVWVGPVGCYYQDPDGHYWSSVDLGGSRQPCDLCGRETRGGYGPAMTDVLICPNCVVHASGLTPTSESTDGGGHVRPPRAGRPRRQRRPPAAAPGEDADVNSCRRRHDRVIEPSNARSNEEAHNT